MSHVRFLATFHQLWKRPTRKTGMSSKNNKSRIWTWSLCINWKALTRLSLPASALVTESLVSSLACFPMSRIYIILSKWWPKRERKSRTVNNTSTAWRISSDKESRPLMRHWKRRTRPDFKMREWWDNSRLWAAWSTGGPHWIQKLRAFEEELSI